MCIETALKDIMAGQRLDVDIFMDVFSYMISGNMSNAQIAQSLQALETLGITEMELHVGAQVLRDKMLPLSAPIDAMDIVGTGGDGLSTYNISTACCFVVAGAGIPVAKHGNRAVSSKSGASDVLRELGVKLDISIEKTQDCITDSGVGFLFAPNHHKAMGHVAKARAQLGTRTLFNRLGPLCNPANVDTLLLGVFEDSLRDIYAKALLELGAKRALIVHGGDGMDEITTTAPTMVSELRNGNITEYEITPEQFGLKRSNLADLEGGDPQENAKALLDVLADNNSAYRDIVLLNSGAAIYISGQADSIEDGITRAKRSIKSGKASHALARLIEVSNA